jgi:flagellar capping protein FliD
MVAEIKKNVGEITVLVEKYNTEFALLKEVLSKSLTEKIKEVRDEERKKAALEKEEEIKKIDLEYQAAFK